MKRSYKLLVLTASVLVVAAVAFYFNGLQGEVFLVTKEGRALPAPGAKIQLFREGEGKSFLGFLSASLPAQRQHATTSLELLRKANQVEKAYAQRKMKPGDLDLVLESLKQRDAFNDQKYCLDLEREAAEYFGSADYETNADKNGNFSLKLLPGTYTLLVEGQAGTAHALWVEEVRILWRSRVRIVDPKCQYSIE